MMACLPLLPLLLTEDGPRARPPDPALEARAVEMDARATAHANATRQRPSAGFFVEGGVDFCIFLEYLRKPNFYVRVRRCLQVTKQGNACVEPRDGQRFAARKAVWCEGCVVCVLQVRERNKQAAEGKVIVHVKFYPVNVRRLPTSCETLCTQSASSCL